jgi:aspartyl-tRNA(Asn)/glutamyl-tRNA(Gln) amidotransferase subunit C
MAFDPEQVVKIATLARLKLTEDELSAMAGDLSAMLDYVEQLQGVDTEGVEPFANPSEHVNVFRDDVVKTSSTVDQSLANAPKRVGDFFAVPPILD